MTTTTTWREAEAARLRSRAADVAREIAKAPPARAKVLRRILLGQLRDAAALAPIPLELPADAVRAAREAARCPVPGCVRRPTHGAVLCDACKRARRYCWRCGWVRPRSAFHAGRGNGQCAPCARDHDPRPRLTPEQLAEVYREKTRKASAAARAVTRAKGEATEARVVAAVLAAGGPPGPGVRTGFWEKIGEATGLAAEGARAAWRRARGRSTC